MNHIGESYDSKAYLINQDLLFKVKISNNQKKGYEKAIKSKLENTY